MFRGGGGGEVTSRLALTGVDVDLLVAVAAVHGAAPVELALALGGAADPRRVVTPAAAHHLAAVHPAGRPVTNPPPCPHRPWKKREKEREVSQEVEMCFKTVMTPDLICV